MDQDMYQEKKIRKIKIQKKKLRKKQREEKLILKLECKTLILADEKLLNNINKEILCTKTISIAFPGSILDNAQSQILKTYLIGQIARAATIFKINEIIIFNEIPKLYESSSTNDIKYEKSSLEFAHVLQYLECPQYLRKTLFPHHASLQYVGLLNPLDSPHHLRREEDENVCLYREGVIINTKGSHFLNKKLDENLSDFKPGSNLVDIGLYQPAKIINKSLKPGTRVTVKLIPNQNPHNLINSNINLDKSKNGISNDNSINPNNRKKKKNLKCSLVSPTEPLQAAGLYWGYNVRLASQLSKVFSECPYPKYDLKIGTSDKDKIENNDIANLCSSYKHCIIVFGGLKGLEYCFENDDILKSDYNDVKDVFNLYLNVCPSQGSRTIRTEEALLIAMSILNPFIKF
ncbi:putative methyltransferase C9orf114 isoform X2 [Gordionus sp. m RMFG-2023]|uniref:putative methyltransferase C9orf114 isoform X2 n=1 Tax=Gordionus sp. m RMFG-2023 TaxID=3053472 RepID=UPI0031FC6A39